MSKSDQSYVLDTASYRPFALQDFPQSSTKLIYKFNTPNCEPARLYTVNRSKTSPTPREARQRLGHSPWPWTQARNTARKPLGPVVWGVGSRCGKGSPSQLQEEAGSPWVTRCRPNLRALKDEYATNWWVQSILTVAFVNAWLRLPSAGSYCRCLKSTFTGCQNGAE